MASYSLWDTRSRPDGAAAIVASALALIRAAPPDLDADGQTRRFLETARDRGAPGREEDYGWG